MNPQVSAATTTPGLRLFIALPVPVAVKDEIQQVQDALRRKLAAPVVRWTRPEQWHLTLKFLGQVAPARVSALTEAISTACKKFAPLKLRAESVGCFPNWRNPRVLWVGVHDQEQRLAELAWVVEAAAAALTAQAREGKFTGHITMTRIQSFRPPEADILAGFGRETAGRVFGEWTADVVEVMRSELSPGGAKHTCLARLPLDGVATRSAARS